MALRVEPFVPALRDLSQVLAKLSVDWAVVGAVAANKYRDETRTTTDLDVLLALAGSEMADIEAALHQRDWTTTALVPDGWLLRVQHPRAGRIDVIASLTDYEAGALARAHSATVDDLRFKTVAVEEERCRPSLGITWSVDTTRGRPATARLLKPAKQGSKAR